mmetsp:Transcript_371/g.968  ORF Transcript_371/g.968 Transcript_371/m.968 type:complete len:202 (-) Transcript_371:1787-2392(-)
MHRAMRRAFATNGTGGTKRTRCRPETRVIGSGSCLQKRTAIPQRRRQQTLVDGRCRWKRRRQQRQRPTQRTDAPATRNATEPKQSIGFGPEGLARNRAGRPRNRRGTLQQPSDDRIGPRAGPPGDVDDGTSTACSGIHEPTGRATKNAPLWIGRERGDCIFRGRQVLARLGTSTSTVVDCTSLYCIVLLLYHVVLHCIAFH